MYAYAGIRWCGARIYGRDVVEISSHRYSTIYTKLPIQDMQAPAGGGDGMYL